MNLYLAVVLIASIGCGAAAPARPAATLQASSRVNYFPAMTDAQEVLAVVGADVKGPAVIVPCHPGDVFTASAWVQTVAGDGTMQVAVDFQDAQGRSIQGELGAESHSAAWTKVTTSAAAPVGAASAVIQVAAIGPDSGQSFIGRFDSVEAYRE